jgi:tRNA-guanine family transglycosylase
MLGPILLSLHNLAFYLQLLEQARQAIREKRFVRFQQECLARWSTSD